MEIENQFEYVINRNLMIVDANIMEYFGDQSVCEVARKQDLPARIRYAVFWGPIVLFEFAVRAVGDNLTIMRVIPNNEKYDPSSMIDRFKKWLYSWADDLIEKPIKRDDKEKWINYMHFRHEKTGEPITRLCKVCFNFKNEPILTSKMHPPLAIVPKI